MADRVGVMRQGKLEQIAAPDELYDDPATAFVAEFVGIMNRIPGELQRRRDGGRARRHRAGQGPGGSVGQSPAEARSAFGGDRLWTCSCGRKG